MHTGLRIIGFGVNIFFRHSIRKKHKASVLHHSPTHITLYYDKTGSMSALHYWVLINDIK